MLDPYWQRWQRGSFAMSASPVLTGLRFRESVSSSFADAEGLIARDKDLKARRFRSAEQVAILEPVQTKIGDRAASWFVRFDRSLWGIS
jgi:hypothetical protein